MKKNVWILLAGDFAAPSRLPKPGEMIIAVDGGICHAARLAVTPDIWLGDFDSSDVITQHRYASVPRQCFPQDKDETDFELALIYLRQNYPDTEQLIIIGGLGREKDHEFANLWLLPSFGIQTVFLGLEETRLFAQGPVLWQLQGKKSAKISLFAFTPLHGIFYHGLKWPLNNASLAPFSTRAARNILIQHSATIQWQTGCGMVFLSSDTHVIY